MSSELKLLSTGQPRPPINNEPELGYRFDVVAALMARLLRVSGATVTVTSPNLISSQTATTNDNRRYTIPNLTKPLGP